MSVAWESKDPRDGRIVPYEPAVSSQLEAAFLRGDEETILILGSQVFTVKFHDMRQYNAAGLSRQVLRRGPPQPVSGKVDAALGSACRQLIAKADEMLVSLPEQMKVRQYRWKSIQREELQPMLKVYDMILSAISSPAIAQRFGGVSDPNLPRLPLGAPVPAYFANVSDGGIWQRKVLSVLGLRNLLILGGDIFNDLLVKRFSGNGVDYADGTGLAKMKTITGNTVDLDTVVLNPARQLKEINQMVTDRKFSSAHEFEAHPLCRQMVYSQAQHLIDIFVQDLQLTPEEQQRRCVVLPPPESPIYVSRSNTDRGTRAVWHYQNVGVSTFHVNVPSIPDVMGALLKAPFHLVKAFILAHEATDQPTALAEFFEDGISDSCFNAKWKAIEMFVDKWSAAEDINVVLSNLQKQHQSVFNEFARDNDRSRETDAMLRLVRATQLVAFDPVLKTKRQITDKDIQAWIELTN